MTHLDPAILLGLSVAVTVTVGMYLLGRRLAAGELRSERASMPGREATFDHRAANDNDWQYLPVAC